MFILRKILLKKRKPNFLNKAPIVFSNTLQHSFSLEGAHNNEDSLNNKSDNPQNSQELTHMREFLIIEVLDTGCGMSQNDMKGLFTKFNTGKTNTKMNSNGLGLGLYLSKKIWLSLGGDLFWESEQGIGSKFSFSLPFDSLYQMRGLL